MTDKPWETDDPTTEELRERLAVVMKRMDALRVSYVLIQAGIVSDATLLEIGCGCVPLGLSDAELQRWLAALETPLEGTDE